MEIQTQIPDTEYNGDLNKRKRDIMLIYFSGIYFVDVCETFRDFIDVNGTK